MGITRAATDSCCPLIHTSWLDFCQFGTCVSGPGAYHHSGQLARQASYARRVGWRIIDAAMPAILNLVVPDVDVLLAMEPEDVAAALLPMAAEIARAPSPESICAAFMLR